ncbi:antA/AntB antirepressor family protein [Roseomonas sp. HJA6]|uniref:AntA/AntB antirepressor family protein n=1 Tax=Roseomonas alba TaxID=2846776 RepID=A0ABS7A429_9PROT|nr:phage antirepressor N-terminal domain-containing protein [Neoroseomonas alba]MBW6397044.1 antA/AntB antirepressor family protein [Neoroseomonas alba]
MLWNLPEHARARDLVPADVAAKGPNAVQGCIRQRRYELRALMNGRDVEVPLLTSREHRLNPAPGAGFALIPYDPSTAPKEGSMDDNENAIARLLPVQPHRIGEGPVETIAATKLHAFLGAGRDCPTWIKGRIAKYSFTEGVDFVKESRSPKTGSEWGGQNALEWHLTLDMAKELAMVQNNEKGRDARRYFIDCERRLKAAAEGDLSALPPAKGKDPGRQVAAIVEKKIAPMMKLLEATSRGLAAIEASMPGLHRSAETEVTLTHKPAIWFAEREGITKRGKGATLLIGNQLSSFARRHPMQGAEASSDPIPHDPSTAPKEGTMSKPENALAEISFHGATLVARRGDTPETTMVAMKPIVEGMGLDWSAQLKKLKENPVLAKGMAVIAIPSAGGDQDGVALQLTRLNFWLATVSTKRIADLATREAIIVYQEECADTLFAHFFGQATGEPQRRVTEADLGRQTAAIIDVKIAPMMKLLEATSRGLAAIEAARGLAWAEGLAAGLVPLVTGAVPPSVEPSSEIRAKEPPIAEVVHPVAVAAPAAMPFVFEGAEVRVVSRGGDAWFILADICRVLGLSNPSMAAKGLHEDEKGTLSQTEGANFKGLGGGGAMPTVINEAGMYRLVMRSDKPAAERFQRWVAGEVLPSVRKNGGYIAGQEKVATGEMTREELMARAVLAAEGAIRDAEEARRMAVARVDQLHAGFARGACRGGST